MRAGAEPQTAKQALLSVENPLPRLVPEYTHIATSDRSSLVPHVHCRTSASRAPQ